MSGEAKAFLRARNQAYDEDAADLRDEWLRAVAGILISGEYGSDE